MNEVNQDPRLNRKLLYMIIAVLVFLSALIFKFYREQKKENYALKIKLITLNRTRNVTPWERLISKPHIAPTPSPTMPAEPTKSSDQVSTSAASTVRPAQANNRPLETLNTQELADLLNLRMVEVKSLDLAGLERNIEIANEIISREPDSYSAHKAKLISLLVEEGKLDHPIDDGEVNSLLETMAAFDVSSDVAIRKEAAFISNTTSEIETLSTMLDQITTQRVEIETQMAQTDPNAPELRALEIERYNLLASEENTSNKIVELNNNLNSGFPESNYLNEDLVQIPFMRMMAKNDYEGVIDNALTFIEQFPDSPDGYFYMIKALEATGQKEEAQLVIAESGLDSEAQAALQTRLQNSTDLDPKRYWERLRF